MIWKLRRIIVIAMLVSSIFFVFNKTVLADPGGNVTISNISPADGSIANEIVGNPPEWTGYVNISFTLTDNNAGSDMEFYLNVSVNGTWINRLHQIGADTGSWYQHETEFCHTNTTYYWNVSFRDGTADFQTDLLSFRTEARPDPPDTPTPANGSMQVNGNITLSCVVHHPDGVSAPNMKAVFHEWPSGRVIGYDNSSLSDGGTATCDTQYNLMYNGTKYYWYVNATDDEFTSNASDIWFVQTYYNETEPAMVWYSHGGSIVVNIPYVSQEPGSMWYSTGAVISLYSIATFNNPRPANNSVGEWVNAVLGIDVNTSTSKYKNFTMYPDGAGSYGVQHNASGSATNWGCVNETIADEGATFIYNDKTSDYDEDLYTLPNHTVRQHGDQLDVSIYYRVMNNTGCGGTAPGTAIAKIRTYDTNYTLTPVTLPGSWATYNYTWNLNPNTNQEWTWTEIDNLQAGVDMICGECTQFYVDVYYRNSIPQLTTQFYTNDTVDGSWVQLGSNIAEQRTNYTTNIAFSNLEYSTEYWWKVRVFNSTSGQNQYSDAFHFTTMGQPPEPTSVYYSLGGYMYIPGEYNESEVNSVWYSTGGRIVTRYMLSFSNETPSNNSINIWHNIVLSAWAHKGGASMNYDFVFYTNDTVDESWVSFATMSQRPTNLTISQGIELEYNKKYWWRINGINSTMGLNDSSDIWDFTTGGPEPEPNMTYYSMGGVILVYMPYALPEPLNVWYSFGANITIGAPYPPSDPIPMNGTMAGKHIYPNFSCYVEDPQGYRMNVSFYWIDGTLIGTNTFVPSGTRTSMPVGWLTNYTWYQWYAVANNSPDANGSGISRASDTWWYLPGNRVPSGNFTPWEDATGIAIRRKLVGGTYEYFVRLNWNITDVEGDDIEFNCYVDDPSIGNWNDWISRWHITDASNGSYYQDEMLFNAPLTNYTWRVYLADDYNSSNNYMNFTSSFFFWANFNWTPYRATNTDIVQFIDESVNATDYWWYVNGILIANASGLASNSTFNTTYLFNISNVYNVTLTVMNESGGIFDSMTRYIYIDRNLSVNRSALSAITYYGQSPANGTNASELLSSIGITSNAWLHKYNNTRNEWDSYWVDYPDLTNDFNISLWDAMALVVGQNHSKRINITNNPDQREAFFSASSALNNMTNSSQTLLLPAGYNFICWSNNTGNTSYNVSIGLVGGADRIYKYNTVTNTYSVYWISMAGEDFAINPNDVLLLNLASSRTITIGDGFD